MTNNEYIKFVQRMPKALHQIATQVAKAKGISLNKLINEVVATYAGESLDTDVIDEFRKRLEALEKEVFGKQQEKEGK